jgi:hypothetical protein
VPDTPGTESDDLAELDEELDTGDGRRVREAASWAAARTAALDPTAPKALMATEEDVRERLVATPLTSLSPSSVGSLLTNSLSSKTTIT